MASLAVEFNVGMSGHISYPLVDPTERNSVDKRKNGIVEYMTFVLRCFMMFFNCK